MAQVYILGKKMAGCVCSWEKKDTEEEERVKLANGVYQTWVVKYFNALETLIYVFSGGLIIWQYLNPLFKIRGGDLKNSTL